MYNSLLGSHEYYEHVPPGQHKGTQNLDFFQRLLATHSRWLQQGLFLNSICCIPILVL